LDLAGGLPAAETRPLNFQTSPFYINFLSRTCTSVLVFFVAVDLFTISYAPSPLILDDRKSCQACPTSQACPLRLFTPNRSKAHAHMFRPTQNRSAVELEPVTAANRNQSNSADDESSLGSDHAFPTLRCLPRNKRFPASRVNAASIAACRVYEP
jgi:hypothetical protein